MASTSGELTCAKRCVVQAAGLLCSTGGALATCWAQVLDGAVPAFQLSTMRFLTMFALGLLMQLVTRLMRPWAKDPEEADAAMSAKWLLPRHSLPRMLRSDVNYMLANVCYFGAALFLPVGTTSGMYAAFCVVWAGAWAAARCQLTPLVGLAAAVSVLGVVLVSQPPVLFQESGLYQNPTTNWSSPCRQRPNDEQGSVEVDSFSRVYRFVGFNVTVAVDSDSTTLQEDFGENATDATNSTRLNYDLEQQRTTAEWKGYLLLMVAGFGSVWGFEDMAQLQRDVESTTVIVLWHSLSSALLSIVVSAIVEPISILTDGFCISMVIGHSLGMSVYPVCLIFMTKHVPIPMVTLVIIFEFVMLMVFQHTLMAQIAPGHGNWLEWLGGTLCLLATVLGPIGDYIDARRSQAAEEYVDLDNERPDDVIKESMP